MATTKPFDSYIIRINGGNSGRVAMLLCYQGAAFVGRIDFFPDGEVLPQDFLWHPLPTGEYVVLHMPMNRLAAVSTIVREERPLQLHISAVRGAGSTTNGTGYLATTDREPTGEEEGQV